MDISKSSVVKPIQRRALGFSLVEVSLAIAVVAFAFVALFGLIPTGMTTFRHAMNASVGSQIAQRILVDSQQTDFALLTNESSSTSPILKPTRFFDDQGNEINGAQGATYQANIRVLPSTNLPTTAPFVTLATVTIQIARNPGEQTITRDEKTQLWKDPRFSILCYSGIVARNQ